MYPCWLCREATELDDVTLSLANGYCICLRCYGRETGSAPTMPMPLRHAVRAVLARAAQEPAAQAVPEHPARPAPPAVRPAASAGEADSDWQPRWWTEWWEE